MGVTLLAMCNMQEHKYVKYNIQIGKVCLCLVADLHDSQQGVLIRGPYPPVGG